MENASIAKAGNSGGLTMKDAVAAARARVAEAIAVVNGEVPMPVLDKRDGWNAQSFTSLVGPDAAAVLVTMADADAAFRERLGKVIDWRLARSWWDFATSRRETGNWTLGDPANAAGRNLSPESRIQAIASFEMMRAMDREIHGSRKAFTRFSTSEPLEGLGLDDATTVSALADAVAIAGPCLVRMQSGKLVAMESPSWRRLAVASDEDMGGPEDGHVYFEGAFKLGRVGADGATHEVFMGS